MSVARIAYKKIILYIYIQYIFYKKIMSNCVITFYYVQLR